MLALALIIYATSAFPLWQALRGSRDKTIHHALWWAAAAWVAWGLLHAAQMMAVEDACYVLMRYLALALTGCVCVAVLGARRPIVTSWHLVVLGLLSVMLLPAIEGMVIGAATFDWLRLTFVAGTIIVLIVNYLPTRLAGAAILIAAGCGWELQLLVRGNLESNELARSAGSFCIGLSLWIGYFAWRYGRKIISEFDRIWLDFRDCYGLVWGQRMREQFNAAAENAGWRVRLHWGGLVGRIEAELDSNRIATLEALLKRFVIRN